MPPILKLQFLSCCLSLLFCGGICSLSAQDNVYAFQHLTVEDGLSTGQFNYYIYQDRTGFVWISSDRGLNRFDGKNVRQYHSDSNNPRALADEFASVSRFAEDKQGNLWFTNSSTLCKYRPVTDDFQHYRFLSPRADTISTLYYWSYLDKESNHIWVSGGRHLFAMDLANTDDKKHVAAIYVGLKDRMFSRPDGSQLLFQCGYGDTVLKVHTFLDFKPLGAPRAFPHPKRAEINDLRYVNDSLTWVATSEGLYQFNLSQGKWTAIENAYQDQPIRDAVELALCRNGQILLATQNTGIFIYDPKIQAYTGQIYEFHDAGVRPFAPNIVRMVLDRQENLWIYVKDDGVYFTHLNKPKFNLRFSRSSVADRNIKSMTLDCDNTQWLLLHNRVLRVNQQDTTYFELENTSGVDLEQTISIFADSRNRVWVGTLSDLFVYSPQTKRFQKRNDLLPSDAGIDQPGFNDFYETPQGDLLVAVNNDCSGQCSMLRIKADLSAAEWVSPGILRAYHLTAGGENTIAIATYMDTLHLGSITDDDQLQIDTAVTDFPFISEIIFDAYRSHYWVATFNGLYRLYHHRQRWKWAKAPFTDPDLIVTSLQLDHNGELWLTVSEGLMRYQPERKASVLYTQEDGLQGLDYNLSAVLRIEDTLFFGGPRGLNYFRPAQIKSEIPLAKPIITRLLINRKDYQPENTSGGFNVSHWVDQLRLPFKQNNIELTLAALEYSAPHRCQFRYQLLGSTDESIIPHGSDPKLSFPSLNFGNYTLRIWASNSDLIWSEPRDLMITIYPPWYRTGWFYVLSFLTVGGILFSIYRRRVEKQLQEEQLKSKISETQKQLAETETAILRLQMDPHFIFNSMNSIDAYIMQGDRLTAHDYLVRFAELMRGILDNSEHPLTSIEDEIELLQKYLSVEQMRVGPKMTYSFQVADNVDTYDLEIPTMILQPFVENAIWHGIHPKETGGKITVSFTQTEELLICEVHDNGVGRIHKNTQQRHRSKATEITQKRLALLGGDAAVKPSLEFIDHKNEQEENLGTTVRISFPIKT